MQLYQWLCLLGIPSIIAGFGTMILGMWKQTKAVKLGLQAILRDRLLQAFKYYESQGFADYDAKTNVLNMYNQYETLGKNGVMDAYFKRFMLLPDHK